MQQPYDYIVVGAGAGGGPLACRLASDENAGLRVALMDAGAEPLVVPGSSVFYKYFVPAFYTHASEAPELSWEFFVRHYTDDKLHSRDTDPKFDRDGKGIYYPRAAALGGCTTHHAMITLYPHKKDWDYLHKELNDPSWSDEEMRKLFEKIEQCLYLPPPKDLDKGDGHGFKGWLPVSMPDPTLALGLSPTGKARQLVDPLIKILMSAVMAAHLENILPPSAKEVPAVDDLLSLHKHLTSWITTLLTGFEQDKVEKDKPDPRKEIKDKLREIKTTLDEIKTNVLDKNAAAWRKKKMGARAIAEIIIPKVGPLKLLTLFRKIYPLLDPNRPFDRDSDRVGVFNTPLSILHGNRWGLREHILNTKELYPDRLHLLTGMLVTRVIIEDGRAVGVEYIKQARAYEATPKDRRDDRLTRVEELRVRKGGEVILCGGAFNTPQLLMLSGIGPAAHLRANDIKPVVDLPGVGQNLQDRYEVTVVAEFEKDFPILEGHTFVPPKDNTPPSELMKDVGLTEWANHRGLYATNGAVISVIRASTKAEKDKEDKDNKPIPDLFIFGVPGVFEGYQKGYANMTHHDNAGKENHRCFTWVILKARTLNRGGTVELDGKFARRRPKINFNYFENDRYEKKDGKPWEDDLDALVEGIQWAVFVLRQTGLKMTFKGPLGKILEEKDEMKIKEGLQKYARSVCWGHHACGTCKIGKADDPNAVLDGNFRVRGVEGLRVVDASVFPRIPGFFIVTPIYMISEKAAKVILEERNRRKEKRD